MHKTLLNLIFMSLLSIFSTGKAQNPSSIHHLSYVSIEGDTVDLKSYEGKYILFVNVASKCGFTSQYEGLENLWKKHKEQLVVIGFPCNQFGNQEPGSENEIQNFCQANYGVSFPLSEKIEVKGNEQHPIYKWLTDKNENGSSSSSVKWNFQKYLVNPKGELVDYYYSLTKPMSHKITKHFE